MSSEAITRNDLTAILNEVLPPKAGYIPQFAEPTNIVSSMINSPYWECPADGVIVARAVSSGSATGIYIQDTTLGQQACGLYQNSMANNTQLTCTAPVLKGHIYQRNYYSGQGSGAVYYYRLMQVSPAERSAWRLVASVTGSNTVTFEDLTLQGFEEVCVFDNSYGAVSMPVCAIPANGKSLIWGGFYSGVNGLLHGVKLTPTSMQGQYGQTDSSNVLSNITFYLYAR